MLVQISPRSGAGNIHAAPTKVCRGTKTEAFLHALRNSKRENEELAAENAALGAGHRALESQLTTENEALAKENAALKEQATHNSALAAVKEQLAAAQAALNRQATVNTALKKQAAENAAMNDQVAENAALASTTVMRMNLWLQKIALKMWLTS